MSKLARQLKKNWKKGDEGSLSEPFNLSAKEGKPFPDAAEWARVPEEAATKRWYSWNKKQWVTGPAVVCIDPQMFAEGNMRIAHCMIEKHPDGTVKRCVAKKWKHQHEKNPAAYETDVMTQAACKAIARAYNLRKPAKPVDFPDAYIILLADGTMWQVETYLPGKFVKHNNNWGVVAGARNTPQAFSHFSYEFSKGRLVIVDIQGVDDYYTDPQIHTVDKQGFGVGNMGQPGIDRFLRTHHCSELCANLGLTFMAPKILGFIPRQPRQEGTTQVSEHITLNDDHMKISEFLGRMAPKKDSAYPEELSLLGMTMPQFNALVSAFRKADKEKTGFLEKADLLAIFDSLNEPSIRTKAEDLPKFTQRVQSLLDQEGMVDFKSYLLCWTENVK